MHRFANLISLSVLSRKPCTFSLQCPPDVSSSPQSTTQNVPLFEAPPSSYTYAPFFCFHKLSEVIPFASPSASRFSVRPKGAVRETFIGSIHESVLEMLRGLFCASVRACLFTSSWVPNFMTTPWAFLCFPLLRSIVLCLVDFSAVFLAHQSLASMSPSPKLFNLCMQPIWSHAAKKQTEKHAWNNKTTITMIFTLIGSSPKSSPWL